MILSNYKFFVNPGRRPPVEESGHGFAGVFLFSLGKLLDERNGIIEKYQKLNPPYRPPHLGHRPGRTGSMPTSVNMSRIYS